MHILSALFFAISSSGDGFVVGLSYGINKIKINNRSNFIIAFIAGMGTFLSMLCGKLLLNIISPNIANVIGSVILMIFGLYMLFTALNTKQKSIKDTDYENVLKNPEIIDINGSKNIETKEALMLGFILCLNNIGLGIGASITGLNIYITSISSFLFSIIFIQLGVIIGEQFLSDNLAKYSNVVSAIIIILLGLYELLA
ncbi:sporulation membrane protein YtaF [Clostridium rectalis]|uniref:sporulation membrane protein YtaF n=1 Tax=Clostridium rectalis TaxID=2040295 RepID=UPI000F634D87|nr:sporulation membrane protein YtaF [Clostridium rectalis]